MILTGSEIARERANGHITIEPFTPEQVNPNSYNFRLGKTLRVYQQTRLDARRTNEFDEIEIPDDGYVLEPGRLYLAHTIEVLGSEHYAPTFAARSSVARLGLFINLSASLGDIGYVGQWTLQLYSMNRVRVYPGINIGQMMWWKPRGEILLYDGKYQGSVGPRSSDIHVDFDKQFARQRFPGLGASIDVAEVGPKFAELARSSHQFRVPNAFVVPAGEFTAALTDEQRAALTDVFVDLRATVGAFFTDSVARIQKVGDNIRLPADARKLLRARLAEMFGNDNTAPLAVRSSGLDEDTDASSLAGVHQSILGVTGADAAITAIERCWRSYYEAPAVAARIRAGDFDPTPRLAVIVQQMVRPTLAGVAFTGLDGEDTVSVEYVEGLSDELVAGVAVPTRVDPATITDQTPNVAVLREVTALVERLRSTRGQDVDVEWAADAAGVHLIQVRPLTASRTLTRSSVEPLVQAYSLYFDELPASFHLGEVVAVYAGYVAKRGPAHRMAHDNGVSTGAGWVLQFNGRGLHDPATAATLRETLSGGSDECVLDFGDTLRQIVVPKDEVLDNLVATTGAKADGIALHAVVVRDFIRGRLGVISRLAGDDGLVVEYTPHGLMALNRGIAGGETIMVGDVTKGFDGDGNIRMAPTGEVLRPHLDQIARFTTAMHAKLGPVTLEWVFEGDRLYFVDHSVLGGHDAISVAHGEVCISPGTAQGPLLRLDDDDLLRRLSIGPAVSIDKSQDVSEHEGLARILDRVKAYDRKPIVTAACPYAVLSVLIGHVAGFVFDQGSALGHLAILLREAGVPAVAAVDVTGDEAVISDGTITTTGRKGE
ncbi:PEP/pyruvate-binding domain-containing protein [Micromonospora sp. WMMA1363]|uniref:dCTP deaminase domain-containing protein n=1 Tax=Micromonospora sp. WMMA1363 TaxID=3053985 RepID=UPI00259CB60A|nr:PEP/pyruvate-binding domain-containing protein [Micromonospora sp. WMMA1363]MDM4721523.1 PEP/pyruvate-binding domain-containing protein [Micromonospora sp. WMMA1363]